LVTLEVDSSDSDASGFEPIWKNGKRVGFITSGGYGHRVEKSLAMGLINTDLAESGQEIDVHIVGKEKKAKIIPVSPYDPKGELMRA
jgi:dimethylglycine dehydrogenase